jgi:predicted DsbA family dithiol-disulfide isomerase
VTVVASPTTVAPGRTISIEVFSDVVCPWCYIGKRRLETALAELAADPGFPARFELVYRPFQLDPQAPRDRPEPVVDVYARKFGGAERAGRMIDQVTDVAASEGLEFHLDRAVRSNTADAHRLLWWARAERGAPGQSALKESLLRAYFTDGLDVGDPIVLAACAGQAGLPADEATELLRSERGLDALAVALERAADRDITAVPTYLVDDRWAIPGAQDPAVFVAAFRRLAPR